MNSHDVTTISNIHEHINYICAQTLHVNVLSSNYIFTDKGGVTPPQCMNIHEQLIQFCSKSYCTEI